MRKYPWLILLLLILAIAGYLYLSKHRSAPATILPSETVSVPIGQRTKTAGCIFNGALQDSTCTPGAIIPSATKEQICVPGYSKTVRNVTSAEKAQVFSEYGITSHSSGQYEVDHLVSLELGGSNDISNLWPEAAEPVPGFHQKDSLENTLHAEVCNGTISLQQSQQEIATNWLSVYQASH